MAERTGAGWRGKNAGRTSKKTAGSINRAIGGLLLLIVVLVGGILALVFGPTRQTPRSLAGYWVASYADPRLATDPTAEADLAAIKAEDVFGDGKSPLSPDWSRVADHLRSRAENEFALVYVSGRACLSDAGDVLIVPADAEPFNRTGWLELSRVLESVKACKAKQKLLILDVMRPTADPSIGIVTDDVASRTKEQVDAVPDAGRLVLTACAPGQTALSSEFLGRSIFNYYVQEGLRGWADKDEDGSVSARELAGFVAGRVSDWADRSRGTSQTPTLIGAPDLDFRVAVVPAAGKKPRLSDDPKIKALLDPEAAKGSTDAAAKEPEKGKETEAKKEETAGAAPASNYPRALREGWTLVRVWRAAGDERLAPRPLARLSAALLRAERDWRFGRSEDAVVAEYRKAEEQEKTRRRLATTLSRPDELPSVALESALVAPPKEAVLKATADLFAARAQMTKPDLAEKDLEPTIKEFLDKTKIDSHAELSAAVLAALDAPPPRQRVMYLDMLKFADQALRAHRSRVNLAPEGKHAETVFLQQLLAAASGAGRPIPNEELQRAVESVRRGERLAAGADAFPWLVDRIDDAALRRRVAQVLLRNTGLVAKATSAQAWDVSTKQDANLDEIETALLEGLDRTARATSVLPALLPYVEASREDAAAAAWRDAAERARALADALVPPADDAARAQWTVEYAKAQAEGWRSRRKDLDAALAALDARFGADPVKRLILDTKGDAAAPRAYREADDLLRSPALGVEDRESLVAAEKRLDAALHKRHFAAAADSGPAEPPANLKADELKRSRDRADRSRLLLELGGVDTAGLRAALAGFADKPEPASRQAVAKALAALWRGLPDATAAEKNLGALDRLGRIAPALLNVPALDNLENPPPTTRLRADNEALMWAWSAEFYDYLARDYDAGPFVKAAAATLASKKSRTGARPTVVIAKDRTSDRSVDDHPLTRRNPDGFMDLELTLQSTGGPAPKLSLDVPPRLDPRLRIETSPLPPLPPLQPVKYAVKVESETGDPAPGGPSAPPEGFLVRLTVDDRPFFFPVKVNVGSAINAPSLVVTRNAAAPEGGTSELLFRPIKAAQAYHVWVKNPGAAARKVKVQLFSKGAEDPAASAEIAVPAGQTVKVDNFVVPPAPPPAPNTPAPTPGIEVREGLTIRLIDVDRPARDPAALLQEFSATPDLMPANKLVAVLEPRFRPTNPNDGTTNRLSVKVRAVSQLPDGPCEVSLILDPTLVPGLIDGVALEQRTATLTKVDDEAELFVEGLKFAEGDGNPVAGAFLIAVDGDNRALRYRVEFVRNGFLAQNASVDDRTDLRVLGAASPAQAGKPYPFTVAVENPPDGGRLTVGFGRDDNGKFVFAAEPTVDLARLKSVRMTAEPKGVLAFKASIADQTFLLEPKGLVGSVKLQVALNSGAGRREKTVVSDVVFEEEPKDVVLVPVGVDGGALVVRASAKARAGMESVKFFLGKPVNRAIPDEKAAVPGDPDPSRPGAFTAKLPIPKDAKRLDVGVEFTNKVGLKSFGALTYEIPAAVMIAAGPAPTVGTVEGRVTEGEIPQGAIPVSIYQKEAKPQDVKTALTDEKGRYQVKDLKPGTYYVYAIREAVNRKAFDMVTVEAGKTTVKNLKLSE